MQMGMSLPIQLISTDFDGTLFAEFEQPPIPARLLELIGSLQSQGAKWVINTGRDMSSLMEALGRSHVSLKPDYLVLVEREIHRHHESQYEGIAEWNDACTRAHEELFHRVRKDMRRLVSNVTSRFNATIYEDAYSPFCLVAENSSDAEAIHELMEEYCHEVADLQVVRNDVYARLAHSGYNKGTALAEVGRRLGVGAANTFAAGDHLNDIPMLLPQYARFLAAPANAIPAVKLAVQSQNGFVSELNQGHGVAEGLEYHLRNV